MTTAADPIYTAREAPVSTRTALLSFIAVPIAILAIPVFIAGGWPLDAWLLATVLWLANRAIQWSVNRFIFGLPQTIAVAVAGIAFLTRAWGLMIALLLSVHFSGKEVAVPAAILFAILYTADMATRGLIYAESHRERVPARDPQS